MPRYGTDKSGRGIKFIGGVRTDPQRLLTTTTGLQSTQISSYGCSIIESSGTSGAGLTFTISRPEPGLYKDILVSANSTVPVSIQTESSAETFSGTTFNNIAFTTRGGALSLVGMSTSQWGILNVDVLASTAAAVTLSGAAQVT